jgi:hypothetical protein
MEQDHGNNDNRKTSYDMPTASDSQGNTRKKPSNTDKQANKTHGEKTSLRRSWRSASPLRRIEIVVGTMVASATILYYIFSYHQTNSNFTMDHRGYLVVDIATIHTVTQSLDVTVENPGRSIAEDVTVHANETTFDVNSLNGTVQNKFVNGWGEFNLPPIYPSSGKTTFSVPIKGLDMERIKDAKQYVYVAIRITYTDEASQKRQSIPPLCMLSASVEPAHDVKWMRCNASTVIPQMEQWDENENPKYRWPSLP